MIRLTDFSQNVRRELFCMEMLFAILNEENAELWPLEFESFDTWWSQFTGTDWEDEWDRFLAISSICRFLIWGEI